MISLLLTLASLALRVLSLGMLIYCVMSFVMPQSDLYRKAAMYVEPFLRPIRIKLYQWIPALRNLPLDFSPLAVWLLIDLAHSLINILWRAL
jgi:uncharacterized protein YggT (Ycf19 family)